MKHKSSPIKPLDAAAASLGVWLEGFAVILFAFLGAIAPHWLSRDELNRIDRRLRALIVAQASQEFARRGLSLRCGAFRPFWDGPFQRRARRNSAFRLLTSGLLPPALGFRARIARVLHVRLHLKTYVARLVRIFLRGCKGVTTFAIRTPAVALVGASPFACACADTS